MNVYTNSVYDAVSALHKRNTWQPYETIEYRDGSFIIKAYTDAAPMTVVGWFEKVGACVMGTTTEGRSGAIAVIVKAVRDE